MFNWFKLIFIKKAMAQTFKINPPAGLPTDLGTLITTIMSWVLWIASGYLIYVILMAAKDLISGNNPVTEMKKAKEKIKYALIGFVLILIAQSIPGIIRNFLAS
jgi:hypothetical protein